MWTFVVLTVEALKLKTDYVVRLLHPKNLVVIFVNIT